MIDKNLAVPYHATATKPSTTAEWLDGSAVVQMILDQIGWLPPVQLKTDADIQAHLYSEIEQHNSEPQDWYIDPSGVMGTLNNLKPPPPTFGGMFYIYGLGTEDTANRKIVYTLHRYEVATATLVYNGGHWIVVKGVQTDVDPLTNSTYGIIGFWIHNPWTKDPVTGATEFQEAWISYDAWVKTYLTPNVYGSRWKNQRISVCDPDPLVAGELKPIQRQPHAYGQDILTSDQAITFVRAEIEGLGLLTNASFRRTWELSSPSSKIFVQRTTQDNSLVCVVPWEQNGQTTALFQVDARSGLLLGAAIFSRPGPWPLFSRQELLNRLHGGLLEVQYLSDSRFSARREKRNLHINSSSWHLADDLVWEPCWESRRPEFPFYLVSVADKHYYVSTVDGTVYDRLRAFGDIELVTRGGA